MKKLLFINQTLAFGGAEVFNSDLLTWLQKSRNWEISAIVTEPTLHRILKANGLNSRLWSTIVDVIGDWKGLVKGLLLSPLLIVRYILILNEHKNTDIIFMTGFIEKIFVTPLAKAYHIPVCWLEFAPLDSIFLKFFGLPRLLYSFVEQLPNRVIVPTHYTANRLARNTRIPSSKIVVIPLGRQISYRPHAHTHPNSVICISRLESGKGQDLLLQAWKIVLQALPLAKLTIVGEGDFGPKLFSLARRLSIEPSVTFTGKIPDSRLFCLLSDSEVSVFPTLWPLEGYGLVSLEAMAMGIPVVGFNFGPLPETITPQTGILVPPGDVSALARAIIRLLKHQDLRNKLGSAGRKRYENNYTFAKIGPEYDKIFTVTYSSL